MTNTPMTFEEWAEDNMHVIDDMVYAKDIWQASQAQQASVIAELVEALEEIASRTQDVNLTWWQIKAREAIAKVKGK